MFQIGIEISKVIKHCDLHDKTFTIFPIGRILFLEVLKFLYLPLGRRNGINGNMDPIENTSKDYCAQLVILDWNIKLISVVLYISIRFEGICSLLPFQQC